jgi:lipopolysaccharide/colanic/teichoic acid biosynthesis glycosyltransferase
VSRRALDVTVAAFLLAVTAPLLLVLAAAVAVTSRGPVLYTSERVGRGGEAFRLRKLRTMRTGASGAAVTRAGDPRVTAVGRVLRAAKLDELPQLWNVLRGDMSLVGPRPEDPRYVADYTPAQRRVLAVRPGLTSPATILLRDEENVLRALGGDVEETYRTVLLPVKLAIDAEYVVRAGLRADLGVLLRTAAAIVRPAPLEEQLATVRRLAGQG